MKYYLYYLDRNKTWKVWVCFFFFKVFHVLLSGVFFFIFLDFVCKLYYHSAVLILWVDEGDFTAFLSVLDGSIAFIFI